MNSCEFYSVNLYCETKIVSIYEKEYPLSRAKSKQKLRKNLLKVARKKYVERKKERIEQLKAQSVSVIAETTPPPTKRPSVTRKSAQH